MASLPEKAHTCKLPRKNTSFLGPPMPDWAKIDIIGQTILLAELTPRFGSFQNTCRALNLQSNEVKSFFITYLQYEQDCIEGKALAEQWGRDQVVLPADGKDIPQQRPLLVTPVMIAPACDFLNTLGYYESVEAVQAWVNRVLLWPPHIDVAGTDLSQLDQTDIAFPQPQEERQLCRYKSYLGDDNRAVVGLYGAWKPNDDGTPAARLSYIDVPQDSVVYGPGGSRSLAVAGRYYVCWPTSTLYLNQYNDLVLATNTSGTRGIDDTQFGVSGHDDFNADDAASRFMDMDCFFDEGETAIPEDSSVDQGPAPEQLASTVNPRDIFGSDLGTSHFLGQPNDRPPFLPQTAPQGPVRRLEDPRLLETWDTWPGEIYQFRLPRDYTITGPQGHIVTFDPPDHERYDESGSPYGLGGTYHVVPPPRSNMPTVFKMEELPPHVALRVKTTQRLAIIRNGHVLPYFVEAGVQEWSTREGVLDLYGPHGCYNVFSAEAHSNIFTDAAENLPVQNPHDNIEFNDNMGNYQLYDEFARYNRSAAPSLEPIEPQLQGDLLYHGYDETQEVGQDVGNYEQNSMHIAPMGFFRTPSQSRDQRAHVPEPRVEEVTDTVVPEDATIGEGITNGRPRRKRRSTDELYPTDTYVKPEALDDDDFAELALITPTPSRRKRKIDEDDEEFTPTKAAKAKAKKASTASKTPTTKTPIPKKPQQKATNGKKGTRVTRAAPVRKPIGPLLDAIQASCRSMSLLLPPLEKPREDDEKPVAEASKMMLRNKTSKSAAQSRGQPAHDPDETEDEA